MSGPCTVEYAARRAAQPRLVLRVGNQAAPRTPRACVSHACAPRKRLTAAQTPLRVLVSGWPAVRGAGASRPGQYTSSAPMPATKCVSTAPRHPAVRAVAERFTPRPSHFGAPSASTEMVRGRQSSAVQGSMSSRAGCVTALRGRRLAILARYPSSNRRRAARVQAAKVPASSATNEQLRRRSPSSHSTGDVTTRPASTRAVQRRSAAALRNRKHGHEWSRTMLEEGNRMRLA